jgi:hypothetical protein
LLHILNAQLGYGTYLNDVTERVILGVDVQG